MTGSLTVRLVEPQDHEAVLALYPLAFPEEDLVWLVRELLVGGDEFVSLVAERDGQIVGHVTLNKSSVPGKPHKLAVLGPLAVTPDHQRSGVGRALIEESAVQMRDAGIEYMLVLGDPAYYGRFGFEKEEGVSPSHPLPEGHEDAWQGMVLLAEAERPRGVLEVPKIWDEPSLWG